MRRGPLVTALLAGTALHALSLQPALAQEWTGVVDNDWLTAGNWDNNAVPNAGSEAVIDDTSNAHPVIGGADIAAADSIRVGVSGNAQDHLTIVLGGQLFTSGPSYVGVDEGSWGGVSVLYGGAQWTSNDDIYFGLQGAGSLFVGSDAQVTSNHAAYLGYGADAAGFASVKGVNANWTVGGLVVGRDGSGSVTVKNGATVNSHHARIAFGSGSQGEVLVSGAGSQWINTDTLYVGYGGNGQLTIEAGGAVTSPNGVLGWSGGGHGTVVIEGAGSKWDTGAGFLVGASGTGVLEIHSDAEVNAAGDVTLGLAEGGEGLGVVHGDGVNGGIWTSGGDFNIGAGGKGTLLIGGTVDTGADAFIGSTETGEGLVNVDGGQWSIVTNLKVGSVGNGTLTITNGGAVSNKAGEIGDDAGARGAVTVEGIGSQWDSPYLAIGHKGEGTLTIAKSGTVNSLDGFIGGKAGSSGEVTVMGIGSTWTSKNLLVVGTEGEGTLSIADGGVVNTELGFVGQHAGSNGAVTLTDAGSQWNLSDGLIVGREGQAALTVGAGTSVTAQNDVIAADQPGSSATVVVDGLLSSAAGDITFNAASSLSGTGTIAAATGTTTVDGTVAPGNSIGTLNIIGDYVQNAGSVYEVEINAGGQSDLINVSGTATINGGMVEVVPFPDFAINTPYTILTAAGGVTGAYDDMTGIAPSLFLSPTLSYDPKNVYFAIVQTTDFADVALTPNQSAAADGAQSLGKGPLYTAIALLNDVADAQAAFDAISGEIHASAKTAMIEDSRFVREAALDRIRAAFEGVAAPSLPAMGYGPEGFSAVAPDAPLAVWARGFGSWGEWESDGNAADLERSIGGFFVGADALVGESWRLGLLTGYSRSRFDVDERASTGESDDFHLGAYGGAQWGALDLRAGATYTWQDIETHRTIAFPSFSDWTEAAYGAGTAQVFGEFGYRVDRGGLAFEPFANVAYVTLDTDGFAEEGGAAALIGAGGRTDTTFTTLGVRASTDFALSDTKATARGMIGWRHAFGDVVLVSTHAFAGSEAFAIAGTPIAEDALALEAGLDVSFSEDVSFGISYSGQIASEASDHGFKADLTVKF